MACGGLSLSSAPSKCRLPVVGVQMPLIRWKTVVLPALGQASNLTRRCQNCRSTTYSPWLPSAFSVSTQPVRA